MVTTGQSEEAIPVSSYAHNALGECAMTRKQYEAVAASIRRLTRGADQKTGLGGVIFHDQLVNDLCLIFKNDNQMFDADKFKKACKREALKTD